MPGRTPIVHEIVPLPPTAGVLQVNWGPLVCVQLAKVLPAGTASVSVTDAASFGPVLLTMIAKAGPPPVVATETSADGGCALTLVVRLALLFDVTGSPSSPEIVAVSVSSVPAATPLSMRKVKRNEG